MSILTRVSLGLCLVTVALAIRTNTGASRPSASGQYSASLPSYAHPQGPGRRTPVSGRDARPEIDMVISAALNRGRPGGSKTTVDLSKLVEMDMRLTDEQKELLYDTTKISSTHARIAISGSKYRWTQATIPYEIDNAFNTAQKRQIRDAMNEWERLTCIRFELRKKQTNYLRIISDVGCWSQVGMIGGKQELSVDIRGCLYHHTIVHELGHAIGFHHEQTRPDRDLHIKVMTENIKSGLAFNFDKYQWGFVQDYGLKYDHWSVMHYSQWAFSKNGKRTIKTLNRQYQDVIGTAPGASIRDVQTVHLMYKCSEHCKNVRCPANAVISFSCECWCSTGIPGKPVVVWDGVSNCIGPNADTDPCINFAADCAQRAQNGECDSKPGYMLLNCRKSCRICGPDAVCKDYNSECLRWALRGECETNPSFMNRHCPQSCYVCTTRPAVCTTDQSQQMCASFAATGDCENYRESMLERCPMACKACVTSPGYVCRNWHVECTQWKNFNRCTTQPDWMALHCPKACGRCSGGNVPDCKNYALNADCDNWASTGECSMNPSWMLYMCAKSCKTCGSDKACLDRRPSCSRWSAAGYCQHSIDGPLLYFECPVACNHCTPRDNLDTGTCKNYSPFCSDWASSGLCDTKPDLMLWTCPRSCKICGPVTVCKNYDTECTKWAGSGECEKNPKWMKIACAKACNTCPGTQVPISTTPSSVSSTTTTRQTTTPTTTTPTTTTPTTTTPTTTTSTTNKVCKDDVGSTYCQTLINVQKYDCQTYAPWMLKNCAKSCGACGPNMTCNNHNANCDYWAGIGECNRNPSYMTVYCRAACRLCQPTVTTTTTPKPTTTTASQGPWKTDFDKVWCPDYISASRCLQLARQGNCNSDRGHMFSNCAGTCNVCGSGQYCRNFERDVNRPNCDNWARVGHCNNSPTYMKLYCRKACGVCT